MDMTRRDAIRGGLYTYQVSDLEHDTRSKLQFIGTSTLPFGGEGLDFSHNDNIHTLILRRVQRIRIRGTNPRLQNLSA